MSDALFLSQIISDDVSLSVLEPHLYSVYPNGDSPGAYDFAGVSAIYDLVACNRFYNRMLWGYSTNNYAAQCDNCLSSTSNGLILDLACGSLAFTAEMYSAYHNRYVVFLDQSLKLLRKAKSRVERVMKHVPETFFFLHADALKLPFKKNVFEAVISLNLLHCVKHDDIKNILNGIKRVLIPNGKSVMSTLVQSNRWSNRYLGVLADSGALISRPPNELISEFNELNMKISHQIIGNLMFIQYG